MPSRIQAKQLLPPVCNRQALQKSCIFYPDDAYGKDLARLFTKDLERKADVLASYLSVRSQGLWSYIRKVIEIDLRPGESYSEDEAERKKLFLDTCQA